MVWTLIKSGHFKTTYLPRFVYVVCERPLTKSCDRVSLAFLAHCKINVINTKIAPLIDSRHKVDRRSSNTTKAGIISERFFHLQKMYVPNHYSPKKDAQDSDLALFLGDWGKVKSFLRLRHLYLESRYVHTLKLYILPRDFLELEFLVRHRKCKLAAYHRLLQLIKHSEKYLLTAQAVIIMCVTRYLNSIPLEHIIAHVTSTLIRITQQISLGYYISVVNLTILIFEYIVTIKFNCFQAFQQNK
jgi:hypothetical protein